MKIAFALAILIGATAWALPAECQSCPTAGFQCWTDSVCGQGCRCLRPGGLTNPGFCG